MFHLFAILCSIEVGKKRSRYQSSEGLGISYININTGDNIGQEGDWGGRRFGHNSGRLDDVILISTVLGLRYMLIGGTPLSLRN